MSGQWFCIASVYLFYWPWLVCYNQPSYYFLWKFALSLGILIFLFTSKQVLNKIRIQIFGIQWNLIDRATFGTKNVGLNNEVALLMRLESTSELCLEPTWGGHYNEVVLLHRWPLSEVWLYLFSPNKFPKLIITLLSKWDKKVV